MTEQPAASIYVGRTVHAREHPFRRSFSHRIAMLDLDIDRLDEAGRLTWMFRIGRRALFAFRPERHGERRKGASLRAWADQRFAEAGVDLSGGQVRLVTFPEMMGAGFAPISVWLGYHKEGSLAAAIYEVHNTFGETHAYVAPLMKGQSSHSAGKEFFVSPFFTRTGHYRFTLREPGERLELVVENMSADGRSHVASMVARREPLNRKSLLRWLFTMPLSGLGVVVAIHWQALQLLLRGATYHVKPDQLAQRVTFASSAVKHPTTLGQE